MASKLTPSEQAAALRRGAAAVIPHAELERRLEAASQTGRPLRAKLGVDPSRPDLHLGHAVVLRTLRRFQDLGHTAVLIVGDFTGRVGDPSGQSQTRPFLTAEQIEANARTYVQQAGNVLDMERAEVRRNSEWLAGLGMDDVLRLTSVATVARMLERDDFQERYRAGQAISIVEFLYPLLQAMDSVQVRADVELGGTDQTFNLLMGRDVQRAYGQEPQVVLTMPLLEGIDGVRKMSKSFDNYVGLTDPPREMFGKLMRIPDELIGRYLRLTTEVDDTDVEGVERGLADGSRHPAEEKRRLAREVVDLYHGTGSGRTAEDRFDLVFRDHAIPKDVPERAMPASVAGRERVWLATLVHEMGLASSASEARRLVSQGGVRLDGVRIDDPRFEVDTATLPGRVIQVGGRRFVRIAPPG